MLKACSKCGRVHARNYICTVTTAVQQKRESEADKFRNSKAWRQMSRAIKDRDLNLCQCCRHGIMTRKQFTSRGLSVHHIRPLLTDYDLRLEESNLITLCQYHHELAEKGIISARVLLDLVNSSYDIDTPLPRKPALSKGLTSDTHRCK